jgi:hypothetical protein
MMMRRRLSPVAAYLLLKLLETTKIGYRWGRPPRARGNVFALKGRPRT